LEEKNSEEYYPINEDHKFEDKKLDYKPTDVIYEVEEE